MQERLENSCRQLNSQIDELVATQGDILIRIGHQLAEIFARGGQLILAGNGPLQAIAQQIATAFAHRLSFERPPLPATALGCDPVFTAALLADQQAEEILAREYRSHSEREHMLLLFCDRQLSPQLSQLVSQIDNFRVLVLIGPEDVALLPEGREPALRLKLAGESPARLSELCLLCGHLLCELVEGELFGV